MTELGELGDGVRTSRKVSIGSDRLSFIIGILTVLDKSLKSNSMSMTIAL